MGSDCAACASLWSLSSVVMSGLAQYVLKPTLFVLCGSNVSFDIICSRFRA